MAMKLEGRLKTNRILFKRATLAPPWGRVPGRGHCRTFASPIYTVTHRMRPARTIAVCLAIAGVAFLPACGGGDGDDGGLSSEEKLAVLQARADVSDFCSLYKTEPSDLFDRSFETMLAAVRDLSRVYRENPDAKVEVPIEKKSFTLEQIVQQQSQALRKCGRDGRQQAGVLDAALQQS